jgi:hypothetical protein
MELPVSRPALRLIRASLAVALLAAFLAALPGAAAAQNLRQASVAPPVELPVSGTQPPPGFRTSARQAVAIADRTQAAREARRKHPDVRAVAWIFGGARWEVNYYAGADVLVEVSISSTGKVNDVFTGPQAETYLARGHFGGKVMDSPWTWALLCLLFVAPFFDPRRPLRLLHLDLLVLLSFGIGHLFFNRGDVLTSAPLVYPVLLYLLARMLWAGFRPRESSERLVPVLPTAALAVLLVALVAGRVAVNVTNDKVIDVGFASVVGADRITKKQELYVLNDVHGDTYGPISYVAYVPFEQLFGWSGQYDDLPAAHAAAITFDLVTILGLFLLGIRLRAGPAGRRLGLALAVAWAAYPYTLFGLATNTNDGLVAMLVVLAMLGVTSPAGRGALVGLGAAAKFVPLALAPLFARGPGEHGWKPPLKFVAALAGVVALSVVVYLPDGGLREFYDTTIGFQLGRPSPFSVWGQEEGLGWLQTLVKAGAALLAVALFFVPRRRDAVQMAALGAAVLIAVQVPATHWFYFYVVWFAPLVLIALFGRLRTGAQPAPPPAEPERARVPVAA